MKRLGQLLPGVLFAGTLLAGFYFLSVPSMAKTESVAEEERPVGTVNTGNENQAGYFLPPVPESMAFAGEEVPLEHFDVYESLDRELLSNAYFHSQTIRYLKLAPRYFSVIEPILKEEGIPDDFKYLAVVESGFNPRAVSSAGAVGIWQFMRGTAGDYGLEVNSEVDERYHMERSTRAACRYLRDSYGRYGSWTMVAASYNAGRAGVEREISVQKEKNYFDLLLNEETGRYVFRILALKIIMENPESYGFVVRNEDKYQPLRTISVQVDSAVADFAEFAKSNKTNYKILKMLNPWLRGTALTNARGKTYTILLPDKNFRNVKR